MSRFTQFVVRTLQALGRRTPLAAHLALGERGESEAYFYLKRRGYRFVATNFRLPRERGEIDLIGWDGEVLCFVEVKTRVDDSFAPPSTAVTENKRRHILAIARRYLRRLRGRNLPACRFDILSVVPSEGGGEPQFTLQKGAFSWQSARRRRKQYRDYGNRGWRGRR